MVSLILIGILKRLGDTRAWSMTNQADSPDVCSIESPITIHLSIQLLWWPSTRRNDTSAWDLWWFRGHYERFPATIVRIWGSQAYPQWNRGPNVDASSGRWWMPPAQARLGRWTWQKCDQNDQRVLDSFWCCCCRLWNVISKQNQEHMINFISKWCFKLLATVLGNIQSLAKWLFKIISYFLIDL